MDETAFIDVFWQRPPSDYYSLGHTFKKRYQYEEFNLRLGPELPWLQRVREHIATAVDVSVNKLTRYQLKTYFLRLLDEAIHLLARQHEPSATPNFESLLTSESPK